jgi:16S rRNA (uracil1498-N3)-methyltransferase
MRIHRFYIENLENTSLNEESLIATQETDLIHQLKNVFRYKIGQIVYLFNENVGEVEAILDNFGKKDMSFKYIQTIHEAKTLKRHYKRQITLYMSIIKNSNFDLVVEKAVELGVSKIVPVVTERTIKSKLNFERLNKIIREATEQSGRIDLLKIDNPLDFDIAINHAKDNDISYFGSLTDDKFENNDSDHKKFKIGLFIGPEGGFSQNEIEALIIKGIKPIKLGENVLRAETAAIVGCGVISL